MMQDGRALQAGTSHNLGQNFAKAFDISFTDQANTVQFAWTTSWGVSTRLIGALIMAHSDDDGLIVPPRLAPIQVIVVPIYKNDAEKALVMDAVKRITTGWKGTIRFKIDEREHLTAGFKFNEWEVKGVPVRIEVGPKDVEKGSVALARRDIPGRDGKSFVPQDGLTERVVALLAEIQTALYQRALAFRTDHTRTVTSYDELKEAIETGFAVCWWDGDSADEKRIKEETRATIRCIPNDQPGGSGTCIYTGRPATKTVVFARSY
jgi:prolyl-tRNA synthetase